MKWTLEIPDRPGYYWYRGTGKYDEASIIQIYSSRFDPCLNVMFMGNLSVVELPEWIAETGGAGSIEFSGPIAPPE